MRAVIYINCDTPAFAAGKDAATLSGTLRRLADRIAMHADLEQIDEPLDIRDTDGETVGRLTITADPPRCEIEGCPNDATWKVTKRFGDSSTLRLCDKCRPGDTANWFEIMP